MSPQTAKAPPKGALTHTNRAISSYSVAVDAAQLEALRDCYLKDLRRDPRWRQLSAGAQHQAECYVREMGKSGEIFLSERKRVNIVPALPDGPAGGRPSHSGFVSRETLRKHDRELLRSGVFADWFTNGKRLANGLRTNPIRVLRLTRSVWALAWARFKYTVRRGLDQVKTEAYRGRRVGRLSGKGGRRLPLCGVDGVPLWRRTAAKVPDWADYCADVKPELELRRSRWFVNQLFERRDANPGHVTDSKMVPEW
jgi:hypothetical protein